jgi:hypothetical protein
MNNRENSFYIIVGQVFTTGINFRVILVFE